MRLTPTRAVDLVGCLALAVLIVLPVLAPSRYVLYLGTLIGLNAALATSLNLIIGYAGQFALAHAAFYGFGAYTSALLITGAGMSYWAAVPAMLLGAALLAVVIGYPAFRYTGGLHFALITFAFGELARLLAANWYDLTGGPMGLRVMYVPEPIMGIDFGSVGGLYGLALAAFLISLAVVALVVRSRFGRALVAIREDEVLASFLGINVVWYKVAAFALSAMLAALAGAVYAPFMTFISPDMLSGTEAISLVGVLVVGGIGTLSGPIIGTLIFFGIPELFRVARFYRLIVLGIVIIATVIVMPDGIAGLLRRGMNRLARLHAPPAAAIGHGANPP